MTSKLKIAVKLHFNMAVFQHFVDTKNHMSTVCVNIRECIQELTGKKTNKFRCMHCDEKLLIPQMLAMVLEYSKNMKASHGGA